MPGSLGKPLALVLLLLAACTSDDEWGERFRTDRLPWLRPGMRYTQVVNELGAEPVGREDSDTGEVFLIWSFGAGGPEPDTVEPEFTTVLMFRGGVLKGVVYSDPRVEGVPWSEDGQVVWARLARGAPSEERPASE